MSDQLIRIFANNDPLLTVVRDLGLIGMDIVSPCKTIVCQTGNGAGLMHENRSTEQIDVVIVGAGVDWRDTGVGVVGYS